MNNRNLEKIALVVNENKSVRDIFRGILQKENFLVLSCSDTDKGLKMAVESSPDLIFIGAGVPRLGGSGLCRLLRSSGKTKKIPIVMVLNKPSETEKIISSENGADACVLISSPDSEIVNIAECSVRIFRRMQYETEDIEPIDVDGLTLNIVSRVVFVEGKELKLRPLEFDLLHMFLKKSNEVLSREYIYRNAFKNRLTKDHNFRTIDAHIKTLRRTLGPWGKRIITIFGFGYKFIPQGSVAAKHNSQILSEILKNTDKQIH